MRQLILTIDLNPTIYGEYLVDEIPSEGSIEGKSLFYGPGGCGIKIARLLRGSNGEFYHKKLVESGISHRVITIKDDTRTCVRIKEENENKITIWGSKPRVTREEMVQFYELYSEMIYDYNIIIGSGTLPQGIDSDLYFNLINLANRKEKIFILDGLVEGLEKIIDASPQIVVIGKKELENLVKLELNFENEIIKAGRFILDKGVKVLIINLYEKGIIVLEESIGYRLDLPEIEMDLKEEDNIGLISGLALGISRKYDFEMTLKLSQAFSLAYSMEEDISRLDMSDIKRLMGEIDIYPINH